MPIPLSRTPRTKPSRLQHGRQSRRPSRRREFDRVVHEIEQHLLQLALVAPDERQIGRYADHKSYAGVARARSQQALDPLGNLLNVDIAFEQHQLAGFGFCEVENVVDDVQKVAAARMDVRDVAAVVFVARRRACPASSVRKIR